jgi:hypothetical protein
LIRIDIHFTEILFDIITVLNYEFLPLCYKIVLKLTQECHVLQGAFAATFASLKMSSFLGGEAFKWGTLVGQSRCKSSRRLFGTKLF